MLDYLKLESITFSELAIRIVLAIIMSFFIGFDRDAKNKPIDLRAYIILSVATCIICIAASELSIINKLNSGTDIDLAKIIAGILTGIGFLGAGAIIKTEDNRVIGSATGASIWASGVIGVTIGFGFYSLAFICFISIGLTLLIGGVFQEKFLGRKDHE